MKLVLIAMVGGNFCRSKGETSGPTLVAWVAEEERDGRTGDGVVIGKVNVI
ncbi:MAG: hypothetical protein UX42_C0007G0001, partial [Microgenomates group bacterium GW2011_GWC1_46_20]